MVTVEFSNKKVILVVIELDKLHLDNRIEYLFELSEAEYKKITIIENTYNKKEIYAKDVKSNMLIEYDNKKYFVMN